MKKTKKFLWTCMIAALLGLYNSPVQAEVLIPNPDPANYPEPEPLTQAETDQLGKLMPRTMYLLESSTPENRKKVKIAIYGQSLSDSNNKWWRTLEEALKTTYPNADIEVNCLGVGGFASSLLWRTTYQDIATYYPDLVIFHVLGHHTYYETILRFIRGCTTSEILVQTDHLGGNDGTGSGCDWNYDLNNLDIWENRMSFQTIPAYCEKYGLERDNRRQEWYDYLKANCYTPKSGKLLSDDIHFADQGNYLTAALAARHFRYNENDDPDPNNMVTIYKVGTDVFPEKDSLKLAIEGNRVDIITENGDGTEAVKILIDDKKPSEYPGCYNNTRACGAGGFWSGGAIQTFGTSPYLEEETWTIEMDGSGNFILKGDKTGIDGTGNKNSRFESNSGKIVIRSEDWWEAKSMTFSFNTKLYAKDTHILPQTQTGENENLVTLAQGFPNDKHELCLVGAVNKIKEIRIYKPAYQLKINTSIDTLNAMKEATTQTVTVNTNTYWQIYDKTDWISVDAVDNNTGGEIADSKTINITVDENNTGAPREASIILVGVGAEPRAITVKQTAESGYTITVNNGKANPDTAIEGATVTITADHPEANEKFDKWTGDVETIADINNPETTLTMPGKNITITATYKDITSIDDAENEKISVYPNPAENTITLQGIKTNTVEIYNAAGIRIYMTNEYDGKPINITHLKEGFYIIKTGEERITFIKK